MTDPSAYIHKGADAPGWTLDVLNVVRRLGKREFSLAEVYAFGEELRRLHPANRHIEPTAARSFPRKRESRAWFEKACGASMDPRSPLLRGQVSRG